MKLGAHCPNRRRRRPQLRSWENQFLRPNRNFHEIGCPRPKSAQNPSPSSDHEKINFYGRIAIFMKLGAHGPNRRRSRTRAQIMRKSIFTAETQFSWNWVPTAQIGAEAVPQLRSWENQFLRPNRHFHEIGCPRPKSAQKPSPSSESWENQFLRPNRNFHEIGCPRPKSAQKPSPSSESWENQFLRPNRNFHEIGCPRPKSAQNPSPSSDHEKINFYGRIAIFMKLGAHGPNRRRSLPPAQIMRKSIFTAESQFSWNWVPTAQIGAEAVPELRSWENEFLRPNRNFHEIGCPRPKSAHKPSPSSDHEKINFYGRIAIFMKLGAHGPNRRRSRPPAQIMRQSIFTAESQFSWNWVPTAQIGPEAVPQLRSWENQFLRPNRNFHEIGCPRPKSAQKPSPSSDHEKINFYGRIAIFMKLGAHGPNRRRSRPPAQIMRKSIFTAESQFSWNWVPTAQIGEEAVPQLRSWENQFLRPNRNFHEIGCPRPKSAQKPSPELRSWENQFLRPNRNFHEIGCPRPKSAQKPSPSSGHEKINFYGRIAIFMKLGAHGPNRRRSRPLAQIMRKSIFTAESQFSWNWVPTAQIDAEAVPQLRSWKNQFLRPNRNFHEIGCPRPKSAQKPSPSSESWENQFLRPNRNFHEIGCPRPKSAQKPSPSSDHEKINFYGRIAIFMKLGVHGPNRRRSRPPAQIMRKSIFTAESQFSWNWVPTAQIGAEAVPELRSWENQFLRPNRNFHEIGCPRPKSAQNPSHSSHHEKINFYGRIAIFMKLGAHGPNRRRSRPPAQIMRKSIFTAESQFSWNWVPTAQIGAEAVPQLRSWENQFLRPNRNFHEIGCPRPKSAQKPSPSSGHEKINFYGRIAIFMKLGTHGPNRRRSRPRAQIMSPNQFLRPNRNFHEIGCPRPKSAQKPSPSSDHEKINFYCRIAIFMKLGAHGPNRRRSRPRAQIMRKSIFTVESQFSWNWVPTAQIGAEGVPSLGHEKINFYGRFAIFMKLGTHGPNRRRSGPLAQIMRKSIFTAESQFSWNWVPTAQIGAEAVPQLRSWENQFLRPNRNFHEIGCPRPKSAQKPSPSSDHEKINFYFRIAIFMKLGAHGINRRRSRPWAQIMRKSIFTAESQFSWNWVSTAQIGAEAVPQLRSWENQFLRPNCNYYEIGCPRPKSAQKPSPSSDDEKINFYGRIAIFMKLGAHGPNRPRSRPRAQIMRKSIFTAESQFSWNWVPTAQIGAEGVPELRSWENQFLRPNRNFHEIGCPRPKSAQKPSPSSHHEKINFYGRIAIFMKLGAHGRNRRRSRSPAQIMRKSIFTAESQFS